MRASAKAERSRFPQAFRGRNTVATIIYIALHKSDRPLRVEEIAERSEWSQNTIDYHVGELARHGLVEKRLNFPISATV